STAANSSAAVLSGLVAGDDLTVHSFAGIFTDKNAGTGKTVLLLNGYSGMDLGNYTVADQATTTASITPKTLTVSGLSANNKVYDGTTAATLSTAGAVFSGLVAGDDIVASGSFADKNAGSGKTVTLAFGGADAGNYAVGGQTTATAGISPKTVTLSGITASDKVYDGTLNASVNTGAAALSGIVAGDDLSFTAFGGSFADKNAGTGKTVNLLNGYSGLDLGNYAIVDQATTSASITPRPLTVALTGTVSKPADGTTAATLATANYALANVVAGESVYVHQTAGSYDDPTLGAGKTVSTTLAIGDYAAGTGTRLANYQLVTGPVSAAVGEILAPQPDRGAPSTAETGAYTGALAAAISNATANPALIAALSAASSGAGGQRPPLAALHIIDGGLRLPQE
ncbi:MAG TPA: YDG domain-containing protein, partial [Azonexus sp.]